MGTQLRGRQHECATLDALVGRLRAGGSQVLVLRGEAGVGKTALLDYLASGVQPRCRVARAVGVESEVELPFSGLHQLCGPMLDHLDHLPGPQRDALATAFGMHAGQPPDRFMVGLAVLSLLADVAEKQPLVCAIDDAQWLDVTSAQILAFVARRLMAEPVGLVIAVRGVREDRVFVGQPTMQVRGLTDGDARALLDTVLPGDVDSRVRETIVAEARGNPLALLELPRGLSAAELTFGYGLADTVPLETRLEQGFSQRLEGLPRATRLFLLTAALEPVGDMDLLRRAVQRLDVDFSAAAPAVQAGLIEVGVWVRFRHPLARSAVARAAELRDLQAAHLALAEETDPELDPDRRAWHRAHAAGGPDEDVAHELERCADRARARGGLAAQAAFLERAIELTQDPARRPARILAAARARHQAGSADAALALLEEIEAMRAGRVDSRRGGGTPGSDRVLLQRQPRRAPPSPLGGPAHGSRGRDGGPRPLSRRVGGGSVRRNARRRGRCPRGRGRGPNSASIERSCRRSLAGQHVAARDRWVRGRCAIPAPSADCVANR